MNERIYESSAYGTKSCMRNSHVYEQEKKDVKKAFNQ